MKLSDHPLSTIETSFRGWTKPGPEPDRQAIDELVLEEGETLDGLSGHFRIFQLRDGHRFSTDDVLTAWYGTSWCPCARRVLDLGSGIGSVGMTAAWRLPGAHFVTVEAQEISVELAKKSARFNGLTDRYEIRLGDFRDPQILGGEAPFDLILGSPPYWPLEEGTQSEHPQKIACRFEVRGDIADYTSTAAQHLAAGGVFCCVFPVDTAAQQQRVRDAAEEHDLCILRHRPVVFREGAPPQIGLFLMMKRDHIPLRMHDQCWGEPPLIIRDKAGAISAEYSAIKLSFGFPP